MYTFILRIGTRFLVAFILTSLKNDKNAKEPFREASGMINAI